jgi:diguanylate cyclase (GGDEF)-like protein
LGYPPEAVTVSVGIAEFDPTQPSSGDLLVNADRALYRAKAAGRNMVV